MHHWRPMAEFDPDKRGLLVHDQLNDLVLEWEPERHGKDWHQGGHHDWGKGIVNWDGLLLDGWMPRNECAELGVDGNCGFALLGDNLQDGEAEFVPIATTAPEGTAEWRAAAAASAETAYRRLRARLPDRPFRSFLGISHPDLER
jgi:hypothetical protein